MWRTTCILLICLQLGIAQLDLASLIFNHVHDSLKQSQKNMGSLFSDQFGSDLSQQIFKNVQDSLGFGGGNLGASIAENVRQQLAPLQFLGANIHHQVNQALMPVKAMGIKNQMINGVGGTTVATYFGNRPRSFIIKDGIRNSCNGNIQGGQCYGYLEPFDIATRQDFCYAKSYASINNRICLSSGHINVERYNNEFNCQSDDGSPTLIMTLREYQQLCGNIMPWQVVYTYYSNPSDPRAIPIPHPNPHVTCRNNEPGVCEFEAEGGGSGTRYSSSSGFNINYSSFP